MEMFTGSHRDNLVRVRVVKLQTEGWTNYGDMYTHIGDLCSVCLQERQHPHTWIALNLFRSISFLNWLLIREFNYVFYAVTINRDNWRENVELC